MDSKHFDRLAKTAATGASRRHLVKGLVGGALGVDLLGRSVRHASAQEVTPGQCAAQNGGRCRTDANCRASNPCCVGQCVRGNAGQGVGGNECQFTVRQCTRNRVPVVQNGRCRCAPASAA